MICQPYCLVDNEIKSVPAAYAEHEWISYKTPPKEMIWFKNRKLELDRLPRSFKSSHLGQMTTDCQGQQCDVDSVEGWMLIPESSILAKTAQGMESMQLTSLTLLQETDSSTPEAEVPERPDRVAITRTNLDTHLGPRLEACWMQLLGVPGDLFQICFPKMVGRQSRQAHLHGAVVQLMPFFERDGHQIANRQKVVVAPLDCQKRSLFSVDRRILRPINHLRDSIDLSNKYRYKVVVQASATGVINEARLCQQAKWTSTCSLRLKNGSVKEYDPMCVRLGIPLACRADSGEGNASAALATFSGTSINATWHHAGSADRENPRVQTEEVSANAGDPCSLEKASVASSDRSWVLM